MKLEWKDFNKELPASYKLVWLWTGDVVVLGWQCEGRCYTEGGNNPVKAKMWAAIVAPEPPKI